MNGTVNRAVGAGGWIGGAHAPNLVRRRRDRHPRLAVERRLVATRWLPRGIDGTGTVARLADMAHLEGVTPQPLPPPPEPSPEPVAPPPPGPPVPPLGGWFTEPLETREVLKARERADRAARRADRAARRVREAQERAAGRSSARQLVDAAGDAATAALTAVSAAADEAQARLAEKARLRELEYAVVTARAGGQVDITPPTREEALKLADRVDPGSSGASLVRGLGFILAGIVAFAMMVVGGFGWLGVVVPVLILIVGGSLGDRIHRAERSGKAAHLQFELARASLGTTKRPGDPARAVTGAHVAGRPSLIENGDPRTSVEVLAVLDRLIENVIGRAPETDVATLRRIRDSAALALPATDGPLDLTDHETWLLRQICIDYLPGALDHYLALPAELASEPVLDGRSARQVLDEQLALIERRLGGMATRTYRLEAGGLLNHARFVADSLRPDPFQVRLAELADAAEPVLVAREQADAGKASITTAGGTADDAALRERERA